MWQKHGMHMWALMAPLTSCLTFLILAHSFFLDGLAILARRCEPQPLHDNLWPCPSPASVCHCFSKGIWYMVRLPPSSYTFTKARCESNDEVLQGCHVYYAMIGPHFSSIVLLCCSSSAFPQLSYQGCIAWLTPDKHCQTCTWYCICTAEVMWVFLIFRNKEFRPSSCGFCHSPYPLSGLFSLLPSIHISYRHL